MRTIGALLLFAPRFCVGQFDVDCAERDFFEVRSELKCFYENLLISDPTNSEVFGEGGKYSNFKRWEEYWSTRIPPGKTIEDFEIAKKASYQALEAKQLLPKSNLDSWHEIGPIDKPNSGHPIISPGNQNSEAGIGPIHFISFCDADAGGNIALCGSASGGLFYRDISTMSQWSNAGSDSWPYSGCRHAVFKVGTCDVIFAANSNWLGRLGGIHRYDPTDQEWEQIADESDFDFWAMIKKLHTDGSDPNVLYAATTKGLYRTLDANGDDPLWTKIVLPNPTDPIYGIYDFDNSQHIEDLEMEPGNSQHIYISVKFHGPDPNDPEHFVNFWTVLQSVNGGQNWTPVPNIPTDDWETYEETDNMYELITLEVSPANNNALWVQLDNFDAPGTGSLYNDNLFKYTNTITGLGSLLEGISKISIA